MPKCCPIFENDCFLLSVMKMWVTQCIFLHSSTFYHVNLGKSQFSCLDMRFTKVGKKFVKKVFKLDVDIFHQKQPNCKLDSYERTTKKENSTISSWDWWRYRSEAMSPVWFERFQVGKLFYMFHAGSLGICAWRCS